MRWNTTVLLDSVAVDDDGAGHKADLKVRYAEGPVVKLDLQDSAHRIVQAFVALIHRDVVGGDWVVGKDTNSERAAGAVDTAIVGAIAQPVVTGLILELTALDIEQDVDS